MISAPGRRSRRVPGHYSIQAQRATDHQICLHLQSRRKDVRLPRFCNSLVRCRQRNMNASNFTAFLSRASSCYVGGSPPLRLPEQSNWILQLARSTFPETFVSDFQKGSSGKTSPALNRDANAKGRRQTHPSSNHSTGLSLLLSVGRILESLSSKLMCQWHLEINQHT